MSGHDENALLVRNLRDAGCGPRLIGRFLALRETGDVREQLRLLARHRFSLLERIHAEQRKVDCLDYLVFNMKQETTTNAGR